MGCQVPARLTYCDLAVRNVSKALGIELVDMEDAGCCGYPLRFISTEANLALSGRNLALVEKKGLDIMTLCNSCYSSMLKAEKTLREDPALMKRVNGLLEAEGIRYEGRTQLKDILQIFYLDYGVEKIRSKIKRDLKGLRVAVHYGCHLLRPSKVMRFDNAENPHIFDDLVEATGAESIYWPLKLWCCGCPTLPIDENLALSLARRKIKDARDAGARCIVTTCPSCQISFDIMQPVIENRFNERYELPVLYYPQLLGLSLGMDSEEVGLNLNRVNTDSIIEFTD